jgi:hypothetical protein
MKMRVTMGIAVVVLLAVLVVAYINWRAYNHWKAVRTTVFRLVTIEKALAAYAREHGQFPSCHSSECLAKALPEVCDTKPVVLDGWGRSFSTEVKSASYLIFSGGADNLKDKEWRGAVGWQDEPWQFEYDIVLKNGQMPQYPWGILAGWNTPPWSVEIEEERQDVARGALYICVSFDSYPAPQVRLYRDGELLSEDQQNGRFSFFGPVGEYQIEVLATGREIPMETIAIEKSRVVYKDF